MATTMQRRARPSQEALLRGNPALVPPAAFLETTDEESFRPSVLVDWTVSAGTFYRDSTQTYGINFLAGYGGSDFAVMEILGAPHHGKRSVGTELSKHEMLGTSTSSMASGMGQSLAHSAELVGMLTIFRAAVVSVSNLATSQVAKASAVRRALSEEDIAILDRALLASSQFKYDITP